jgi:hypothetical protein
MLSGARNTEPDKVLAILRNCETLPVSCSHRLAAFAISPMDEVWRLKVVGATRQKVGTSVKKMVVAEMTMMYFISAMDRVCSF